MGRSRDRRKKLSLNRETLRQLTSADMEAVAGGVANTYRAGGGAWCSTVYMTHCKGCTTGAGIQVTDCQP